MKRLCVVTPAHSSVTIGGSEFQIDCLLQSLISEARFEIYYLTSFVAANLNGLPYKIVRIGRGVHAPRFGYLQHAFQLYQVLCKLRPDVIYQRVAGGYSAISAFYARRSGARLVWHIAHDSDVTPGASLEGRNPIRRLLEKRSVEYAIRHATCIVAQTQHQADLLRQNYGREADATIPNFHPDPQEQLDKTGPLTVAWIASLKPWKKPEAFVDLADGLRDLRNVRFVMVGPWAAGSGERRWTEVLKTRIELTSNLQYIGSRTQGQVNDLLAKSHILVNTSLHEGFPNTFIQAWSRDVAIISLYVNPDNLLTDREIGIFCAGSEQRLSQAVRHLLGDPRERDVLTRRGRAYARACHSFTNAHQLASVLAGSGVAA